jgi:membrane-associated phospholipid phosphatase
VDTSFIEWVQDFSTPLLDSLFKAITFLGNAEYYILVIPLLFWLYDKRFALSFGIFFLGNAWLNSLAKYIFRFTRPPLALHKIEQGGFSFPSGHAQGSAGFWGYLAVQVKRPWFYLAGAVLTLLVAFSRIYLGVHFPRDIIVGILLAAAWLAVYEFLARRIRVKLARWQWFLGSLVLSAALLLLHPAGDSPMLSGFLLGALWGYRIEEDWVKFSVKGNWWQNAVKIALGIGVLFGLQTGLKSVLLSLLGHPEPETTLQYGATYLRYCAMGWWVTLLAPLSFKALSLYKKD